MSLDDLLRAIDEDAGNVAHWHPLADWLMERGDPRGELIVIDLALETGSGDEHALQSRRAQILSESAGKLLGDTFAKVIAEGYGKVRWRRGFVDEVFYRGSPALAHKKAVGWLVRLMTTVHVPFTLVRAIDLSHTDIRDLTPLGRFAHLQTLALDGCAPTTASVTALRARRPALRLTGDYSMKP